MPFSLVDKDVHGIGEVPENREEDELMVIMSMLNVGKMIGWWLVFRSGKRGTCRHQA